jgi:hypothetical protein
MNYQYLKSEFIEGYEYALLLEIETGNVIRRPVVSEQPRPVSIPHMMVAPHPQSTSLSPRPVFEEQRRNGTLQPEATFHGYSLDKHADNPVEKELPRPRSIVPPHLQGVFIKEGMQGAAIEERQV